MNKIIKKVQYSEKVFRFDVEAPLIAKSRKAGNFVIIRVDNNSERMPLTIANADIEKGTITLVVQKVGLSSTKLCALNEGDEIHDVVGPLGNPTHIENFGTVICAGGGVGVAPMLPIIKALKAAGNRVLSVIAGRNKDLVIMEDEVRASSDELIIMTDDGSYGEKGVVTVGQKEHQPAKKAANCCQRQIFLFYVKKNSKSYRADGSGNQLYNGCCDQSPSLPNKIIAPINPSASAAARSKAAIRRMIPESVSPISTSRIAFVDINPGIKSIISPIIILSI